MRKTVAAAGLGALLAVHPALAGDPDIGCGWGTIAFRGKSGMAYKIIAATTNASSGSQTFGISSGTAGCGRGGIIRADVRLRMYADANLDALARDMAAGGGEALDALAQLLGIAAQDRPALFHLTRTHFGELFPARGATAGGMLATLNGLMTADARLARYVPAPVNG
jgi:hypothetical protein